MHDNAKPNPAVVVKGYIKEVNVGAMDWPLKSSELIPIKCLWNIDNIERCN